MKKNTSIKRKSQKFIAILLTVIILFTILITAFFFFYNYTNIKTLNANIISDYHTALDTAFYNTELYVINIYANNPDFASLTKASEYSYDTYERSTRIKSQFESRTVFDAEYFGYFIQKDTKNGYYSSYPSRYDSVTNQRLEDAIRAHLDNDYNNGIWYIEVVNSIPYAIIAYHRGNCAIGAALDLDMYCRSISSSTSYVQFASGDTILTTSNLPETTNPLYYVKNSENTWSVPIQMYETGASLEIITITPQIQLLTLIRILIITTIAFFTVMILLLHLIEKNYYQVLIYPVSQLSRMEEDLRNGNETQRINSDIIEYNQINDGILSLIEEVTDLQNVAHEKEMALQKSQLQYYQLQTEPHFFLNCLKNIYALAESHQFEKIQYMITVISKHFRYVFRSNTMQIPLCEELEETQCYFQLCQFSSTVPMILEMHRDEALESCKVPPLLVQTFVENSIKYGKQQNKVLRIDVSVTRENDRIRIRVSDDGVGYAPEILESVRADYFPENGHIGIKNAIDRIRLLYEGRTDIRTSNNPGGGACTEIFIPISEDTNP